jgi:putative ABC transport system substrate-binding protein
LRGLASYTANADALYRDTAGYIDKILRGGKPADLPVSLPTKFELIINLKAAKSLGLDGRGIAKGSCAVDVDGLA